MKTYTKRCVELDKNGGILKDSYGSICYYKPGYINHRVDGPSRYWPNGNKWWYYNNEWIMYTEGNVTQGQLQEFLLRIL